MTLQGPTIKPVSPYMQDPHDVGLEMCAPGEDRGRTPWRVLAQVHRQAGCTTGAGPGPHSPLGTGTCWSPCRLNWEESREVLAVLEGSASMYQGLTFVTHFPSKTSFQNPKQPERINMENWNTVHS